MTSSSSATFVTGKPTAKSADEMRVTGSDAGMHRTREITTLTLVHDMHQGGSVLAIVPASCFPWHPVLRVGRLRTIEGCLGESPSVPNGMLLH